MIVCLCEGVSDRRVRQEVKSGAKTWREVERRCGAGGSCGMCRPMVRDLIRSEGGRARQEGAQR